MSRPGGRAGVVAAALVLLLGAALRVAALAGKQSLEHDDAMTYVASSGRPYSDWTSLEGRWVAASEWKALRAPAPGPRLVEVARHLADSGVVHPPLFFWLLHAWSLAFGTGLAAGPALNVLLALLTGLVLHRLGGLLLGEPALALAATALWALSPGAVGVSTLVRPYEFLMLLGPLLALGVARFREAGRGLWTILAATAAGMLTHYEFAFPVAAAAFLVSLPAGGARRSGAALGALAGGVAVSLLLNPLFYRPFVAQAGATRAASGTIGDRLLSPGLPSLELLDQSFLAPPFSERWSVPLALPLALALALLAAGAVRSLRRPNGAGRRPDGLLVPASFFAASYLGHGAAWVLGLVPLHTTGFRYQAATFPFLALLLAASSRGLAPRLGRSVLAALACLELAGTAVSLRLAAEQRSPDVPPELARAGRLLVDNTGTGVLPRVVELVPDATPVYAAMQDELLARPGAWVPGLAASARGAWASVDLFYDSNSAEKSRAIRDLLGERADVGTARPCPLFGGDVTEVRRRERPAAP